MLSYYPKQESAFLDRMIDLVCWSLLGGDYWIPSIGLNRRQQWWRKQYLQLWDADNVHGGWSYWRRSMFFFRWLATAGRSQPQNQSYHQRCCSTAVASDMILWWIVFTHQTEGFSVPSRSHRDDVIRRLELTQRFRSDGWRQIIGEGEKRGDWKFKGVNPQHQHPRRTIPGSRVHNLWLVSSIAEWPLVTFCLEGTYSDRSEGK